MVSICGLTHDCRAQVSLVLCLLAALPLGLVHRALPSGVRARRRRASALRRAPRAQS
jgi:hypothetical protein